MTTFSFPFVGAGDAQHFEFASLEVLFMRAPTSAQAQRIEATLPSPLVGLVQWHGPMLDVLSEQGVRKHIRAAFKGSTRRFNAAIERWLAAAHAVLPIRVALRTPDVEAGGTAYSTWHRASLEQVVALLPEVIRVARKTPEVAQVGSGLVDAATTPIPAAAIKQLAQLAKEAERRDREQRRVKVKPLPKSRPPAAEAVSLAALEKRLPLTAKRLAKATQGALRRGASAQAIAAVEKSLGARLHPQHKALLACFDGGTVGDIVFLGTPAGGARADAELAAFAKAVMHPLDGYAIAHTGRKFVIAMYRGEKEFLMGHAKRPYSWRGFKSLDAALELALKKGRVIEPNA